VQRHPVADLASDARHRVRILRRVPDLARFALALATIPVAIVANGIRVSGTGLAAHIYGLEAAEGFFHSFSGWLLFLVAFAMLFVLHRLILLVAPAAKQGAAE